MVTGLRSQLLWRLERSEFKVSLDDFMRPPSQKKKLKAGNDSSMVWSLLNMPNKALA